MDDLNPALPACGSGSRSGGSNSAGLPTVGSSAWNRLNARTKQYAHRLRQALASALELRTSGRWGRDEIEAAGRRDYARVFGREISAKQFWRIFDQVIERAGQECQFDNLAIYLPGRIAVVPARSKFERLAKDMPSLSAAILGVRDANAPTEAETLLVWDAALNDYQRLIDGGALDGRARRRVVAALDASGLPLSRTRDALRKSFVGKLARWIEGGRKPSAIQDRRGMQSGRREELPLSDDDRKILLARAVHGNLSQAWRTALQAGELSSALVQRYISNPASKSYVPQRVRDLLGPEVRMLYDIHRGPRQAALKGAYITRDWSSVTPGDWYSADDTTLPLYYWEDDEQGSPRVLRGQCLITIDCRTDRVLGFALHSERNYTAKVIRGLILKTHDTYGLPRIGFFFERGTWASSKLLKGAADEIPSDETEVGLREFVAFKHAKPGNARAKTVERVIGLLQDRMGDQPGYCGRNEQVEKFERLQRDLLDARSARSHPSEFLLHRDEWVQRLSDLCDAYNHEPQQGGRLAGLSPKEAWEKLFDFNQPLLRLSPETRYILSNHRRPLKVTKNGICVQIGKERTWFRNEATGRLIERTVQVYFDPEDLSSVFIKLNSSDKEAIVVPAAPVIPAMSATPDQLRAAQASVNAHNRPARTIYKEIKPYFPKNGPSHFRKVVADAESVELAQEVAADQQAIRAKTNIQERQARDLARKRREFGTTITQHTVSPEAERAAYQLLEAARKRKTAESGRGLGVTPNV